jgi:D-alanyl-D-alanine dipeptidase
VDATKVRRDWKTAENMMPPGGEYRRGIVVRHNWDQRPAAGSCIFLHIRSGRRQPTSGCTAMSERNVIRVLGWLDPAKHPVLVQLPESEWRRRAAAWGLPAGSNR